MNSANTKTAKTCSKMFKGFLGFVSFCIVAGGVSVARALDIDFSRRQVEFNKVENDDRMPSSLPPMKEDPTNSIVNKVLDGSLFESVEPTQDIVIMNTTKGFVPETINLKKGNNYRIHVVNVNNKEKNISFIMDAFSEHHNTFYGEHKTFNVSPKVDGIFSYQCPETAQQGKIIIYSDTVGTLPANRKPASK